MSVKRESVSAQEADAADLLVLAVDTATPERSVAVWRGGRALASVSGEAQTRGAATALADVDEALRRAGVTLRDVGLFAAADGPGSFTGLRAGLATIKAFASTLGRPAVGVRTLHAVALAAGACEKVLALLPAGRGEFFTQLLSVGEGGEVSELGEAAHLSPGEVLSLAARVGGPLVWAGEGAHLLDERMRAGAHGAEHAHDGLARASGAETWVLARRAGGLAAQVAELALRSYRRGGDFSADAVRAFYVRASDAELKERCLPQESPEAKASASPSS